MSRTEQRFKQACKDLLKMEKNRHKSKSLFHRISHAPVSRAIGSVFHTIGSAANTTANALDDIRVDTYIYRHSFRAMPELLERVSNRFS